MSLKESKKALESFLKREPLNKFERKVTVDRNGMAVFYIFDYPIAAHTKDGRFFFKRPSIIDHSIVIRQLSLILEKTVGVTYFYWTSELNGYKWDGNWVEILNTGSVSMINKQNPFKLYEH